MAPNRRKAVRTVQHLTENNEPPEGYDEVEFENDRSGEGVDDFEMEPGDVIEGRVVGVNSGETEEQGDWYRLRIDSEARAIVDWFAKGDAKRAAREGRVSVGDRIWAAMSEDEESFERGGETVTYNPVSFAKAGGD